MASALLHRNNSRRFITARSGQEVLTCDWLSSLTQCFDVGFGHGDAALDVTDVVVKVIEDDPVGHVGQPVEHLHYSAAHDVKLLGSLSPFFTLQT